MVQCPGAWARCPWVEGVGMAEAEIMKLWPKFAIIGQAGPLAIDWPPDRLNNLIALGTGVYSPDSITILVF